MENQQKEIFANCSQTHFAMRKFRRPISQCENSPTQIRNAKISQCEISQCQMPFRNANFEFTLPIPISQCENLAIPISQCENFAMRKFRNAKFHNAKCHFAMPILNSHQFRNAKISQCEISQCQSPFRIAKITAFAKFTLRNLQALSSYVINAEPPSIFGVLLFCPIT